jgi:hypothetical protein
MEDYKQKPIVIQTKRKWYWIGHTLSKPTGSIEKLALDWNPQGAERHGRGWTRKRPWKL